MAETWRQHGLSRPAVCRLPLVIELAQPSGPVYPGFTRAVYIAAHRAMKARVVSAQDVRGLLARAGIEDVPDRTVRNWVSREPDLPEKRIRSGLDEAADYPGWSRPYLRPSSQSGQNRRPAGRHVQAVTRQPSSPGRSRVIELHQAAPVSQAPNQTGTGIGGLLAAALIVIALRRMLA